MSKESYPVTLEFVLNYQQEKGGYIQYARACGLVVDPTHDAPSQKWHFFESLIERSLAEGSYSLDDLASARYNSLKCPELLLWIAEASGVGEEVLRDASDQAKTIIDSGTDGRLRNKAGARIRQSIPWSMLECCYMSQERSEDWNEPRSAPSCPATCRGDVMPGNSKLLFRN